MREIHICMGSSCFSRGNAENLRLIREYLKKHGLAAAVMPVGHLCEGQCSEGPNLKVDGAICHRVDTAALGGLLERRLKARENS